LNALGGTGFGLSVENLIGKGLADFAAALARLDQALAPSPGLHARVFDGTQPWRDLLTYKLVPHMAGAGCLVAAVTGGTNTGKSTVFNLLIGRAASPIVNTAAATCHPVLAANARRHAECLNAKLVPEFQPRPLESPGQATDGALPAEALFVVLEPSLPDHLVVMDTPDVDSIEKRNWDVAAHLRAAGDVMVAVITGDKYKDERVVEFFRQAIAADRVVIPVMNKANPADRFDVARRQLAEFRKDTGTEAPGFVIAHDFQIGDNLERPIESLDGTADLRAHLESLDVPAIKTRVYEGTVRRFASEADAFLANVEMNAGGLQQVTSAFLTLAATAAQQYDPAPGKEVGGLFHAFVQSKRGPVRRTIGATSATFARGVGAAGRLVRSAFVRRATMDAPEEMQADDALQAVHRETITRIARDMAAACAERARTIASPAREMIGDRFEQLDAEAAAASVAADVLQAVPVSEAFAQHAQQMLETWWTDHKGRRRALEALDAVLAVMPAAIAAPFALHTGGLGAAEAVVFAGPIAAQFAARVMEFQFGDALFDFLSPWKTEQQTRLREAILRRVVRPGTQPVDDAIAAMTGENATLLRSALDACRTR